MLTEYDDSRFSIKMFEKRESFIWSWWPDLNRRPTDYESVALPAELHQQLLWESALAISCFFSLPHPCGFENTYLSYNQRPAHYECAALPLSHSSKSIIDLTVNYDSTFFRAVNHQPCLFFVCFYITFCISLCFFLCAKAALPSLSGHACRPSWNFYLAFHQKDCYFSDYSRYF